MEKKYIKNKYRPYSYLQLILKEDTKKKKSYMYLYLLDQHQERRGDLPLSKSEEHKNLICEQNNTTNAIVFLGKGAA